MHMGSPGQGQASGRKGICNPDRVLPQKAKRAKLGQPVARASHRIEVSFSRDAVAGGIEDTPGAGRVSDLQGLSPIWGHCPTKPNTRPVPRNCAQSHIALAAWPESECGRGTR